MTTLPRRLIWLALLIGLGVLAWGVIAWQTGDERVPALPPPAQAPLALPEPGSASAPPPVLQAAADAPASEPARVAFLKPPPDVMRLQREIQLAISGNEPGKAGEAARHIRFCESMDNTGTRERSQAFLRKVLGNNNPEVAAVLDRMAAACQAVDVTSREQLLPLLRRSLAEGDKGAASALMRALGRDLDLAAEPQLIPALRRDAWNCDRLSAVQLTQLARRHPQLLTPNEVGVLRALERDDMRKALEARPQVASGVLNGMLETYKPPPEADAAEVARVAAEIQGRCSIGAKPAP